MLVIYSDFGDTDTKVLSLMWEGIDCKVIRIHSRSTQKDKEAMIKALKEEEDTVLFCGHGSGGGLWTPNVVARDKNIWSGFAFSYKEIPYVKAKNIIGIWCHASDFSRTFDVRGFYSSMFISNSGEAHFEGVEGVDNSAITKSEKLFCKRVNNLLKKKTPISQWLSILQNYEPSNAVEEFNYNGLYYHD